MIFINVGFVVAQRAVFEQALTSHYPGWRYSSMAYSSDRLYVTSLIQLSIASWTSHERDFFLSISNINDKKTIIGAISWKLTREDRWQSFWNVSS